MANKIVNQNAKEALNQMKLEIANEVGVPTSHINGANLTAQELGTLGGRVGGLMSRKLVQMGEEALLKMYNDKNS